MIVVHHLGVSQSDRIVWLMEELGLPYELRWHDRLNGVAPPSYLALHPAATAPVIEDGGRVLAESAAIIEHVCWTHAGGRLSVPQGAPNYYDYTYWMTLNNNLMGLFFGKLGLGGATEGPIAAILKRREDGYVRAMEEQLGRAAYLAGDEFTGADIMALYPLRSPGMLGRRDDMPNARAYMERLMARPAFQKAEAIAGDNAQRPA